MPEIDRVKLYRDLAFDEGLRLKMYKDSKGNRTIGFGHNLEARGISENVAVMILNEDIDYYVPSLYRQYPWLCSHSEPVQRALANMYFNMEHRLNKFVKMLAALRKRDYEQASKEVLNSLYATQVGERATRIAELIRSGNN